jgi:[ribosomal protein S5]-alanine N-acetyltransferase
MIECTHCLLRPLESSDLDALHVMRNDRSNTLLLGGFSTGYSHADLEAWLSTHRNRRDEVLWAIASKPDDVCIGHVGLYQIDHRIRKSSFGILLGDRDYQGRGIGKEASVAVITYGFHELNLHKVWLSVLATNTRALALYRKLGFQQDGVLRDDQFRAGQYMDSILMSVLATEWQLG